MIRYFILAFLAMVMFLPVAQAEEFECIVGISGTYITFHESEELIPLIRYEESGVMMHLVTPELDKGPPVAYGTYSIRGELFDRYWAEMQKRSVAEIKKEQGENNRLFKLIRQHGLAREFPLIIATLRAFSRGVIPESECYDVLGDLDMPGDLVAVHLLREKLGIIRRVSWTAPEELAPFEIVEE